MVFLKTLGLSLFISSLAQSGSFTPSKQCEKNTDCLPEASCHPHQCFPKDDPRTKKKSDLICTEIFDGQAAYTPKDCQCRKGLCVNKNLPGQVP